ncbi:MAG: Asp23/Gls24 family envelope stress response protein [Anaerolineaceae bacterium]|jgi:uncharacterized alkaline shock family protein YloU
MVKGKTTIAPDVLHTIARLTTLNIDGVSRMCLNPTGVKRYFTRGFNDGVRILLENDAVYVDLYVILKHNTNVREVSHDIQQQVARALTETVGMQVGRVNVHVEDIDYPEKIKAQ